jgi:uncharacterized coiled-coil DUF342 family protein
MKYYSDVLHSLFDTQDALEKAEAEKKEKDDEKVRQKKAARKQREEDKERFLELRKKFNEISAEYTKIGNEYQKYADKMMEIYSADAVLNWLADAVFYECTTKNKKANDVSTTAKTAREPENLGEILIRIFEDMQ